MSPESFSIVREPADGAGRVRLRVCGELDLYTARRLRSALRLEKRADHGVQLDLGEVSFMDSSGLQVLVQAVTDAAADGWQLELGPASDNVRTLLRRTGLADMLRGESLGR